MRIALPNGGEHYEEHILLGLALLAHEDLHSHTEFANHIIGGTVWLSTPPACGINMTSIEQELRHFGLEHSDEQLDLALRLISTLLARIYTRYVAKIIQKRL